uniref:Uncharacterized protein n=1 Tax=Caenorhabditis japonica TaxID=281687 RepID=A0A8R1I1W2_CAEJA
MINQQYVHNCKTSLGEIADALLPERGGLRVEEVEHCHFEHALRVPEAGKQTFLLMKIDYWLHWRLFPTRNPESAVSVVIVEYPALIHCNKVRQKLFPLWSEKKRLTGRHTSLHLVGRESMGYPSRQHSSVTEIVKMIADGLVTAWSPIVIEEASQVPQQTFIALTNFFPWSRLVIVGGRSLPSDMLSQLRSLGINSVLVPAVDNALLLRTNLRKVFRCRHTITVLLSKICSHMVESGACQSIGNAASDRVQRAYDDKHTYHIKVINSSARRIGYGIKTTNMKRLGVDPLRGVLDPKEAVSPSSGPTLRMEPPSSSVASGSSETVWCAEREPSNRVQSINRVKFKCQNFNFSVIVIGAVMLMPTHALILPNFEERLDLTGFETITEQTATLARLMNAIFLQNYFHLELVTMEDVIAEVFDVPSLSFFNKINERDIRDTVNDMKAFDVLTELPIDERERMFDGFLLKDTLTKISTVPDLSAYANVQINYSVLITAANKAGMDITSLMGATKDEKNRDDIGIMKGLFQTSKNSTMIMVEHLKNFHEMYENKLDVFDLARLQLEEIKSVDSSLKAFQQVVVRTFLKSLTEKLESLKLHTPILESWVNSSHRRERIIRQATFMHDLLRKSGKAFDKKILIGLPNGSQDLAELAEDFQKAWLKKLLNDGKSLNALETLLTPMKTFEKQLLSIEKVWYEPARNEYLNCIHKILKSIQGLDMLKSINISQTLPNAIKTLNQLPFKGNYVSDFVNEFDQLVKSLDENFTSLESDLKTFNAKKNDPYFFNKIDNVSSAYPLNEAEEKHLEYLNNLPYQDYLNDLNFTSDALLNFERWDKNITGGIAEILNFWKKFESFRPTFEFAFNSDVEDVANVLRAIRGMVPFTLKERSIIDGITDFLLAAKAKLSESKQLDAVLQQEMKKVDVNRMILFSNARDIASQFASYHRTLVLYQKPELLKFFNNFRSNGLQLARKIENLPPDEETAVGEAWNWLVERNETLDNLSIVNFLNGVQITEKFFSKNYSHPVGNLTSLAKVLIKLNGITIPAFQYKTMRESIGALKITSLGQSEEVSNAERSLAQLEGVYSSLAHEKYLFGGLLEDADQVFKSFFTPEEIVTSTPPEDWTTFIVISAVVACALVFIAAVIWCFVYQRKFKIADVKPQK